MWLQILANFHKILELVHADRDIEQNWQAHFCDV